ncbi:MAG: trypsin-like peptidase domain-containing protein, partial [Anaerolineales bacterium]
MKSNNIRFRTAVLFSAVILASVMVTGCAVTTPTAALSTPTSTPEVNTPSVTTSGALTSLEGSLEDIYTQLSPSVVNISVIQDTTSTSLFGFQSQQQQEATGSGFIWDRNGYIVTNNHVVENSHDIRVTFSDGAIVSAEVVGTDPNSDLAVIKVDRPSDALPPVTMAPANNVKVGQLAIAIGNPYGLQGSMTLGIVSALGRSLPVESSSTTQSSGYTIPGIIQTDAPINPGNSGGILINDQGEVIGVTSAIISPVDASAGIGFAIPAAIVSKVVPALIDTGQYQHPYIGISGTTLFPEVVDAMNLPEGQLG